MRGRSANLIVMESHCYQGVRNDVEFMGIPLQDAVRVAFETPAEILSLSEKGRIGQGVDADIAILSTKCMVEKSIAAGDTVDHGKG